MLVAVALAVISLQCYITYGQRLQKAHAAVNGGANGSAYDLASAVGYYQCASILLACGAAICAVLASMRPGAKILARWACRITIIITALEAMCWFILIS
jgi:hypothetical protein